MVRHWNRLPREVVDVPSLETFKKSAHGVFMSGYWYRALVLCKETGSCNCFASANQPNEEKEEDTNHQVVVSDTMQLVQDKQEVTEITAVSS